MKISEIFEIESNRIVAKKTFYINAPDGQSMMIGEGNSINLESYLEESGQWIIKHLGDDVPKNWQVS